MSGIWVAIIGIGIAAAGVVVLVVLLRRRLAYSPLAEVDGATRKAVLRAIRTGTAENERVAELARGLADHTPRMRWLPWALVPIVGLQVYVLVERIREGDAQLWLTAAVIAYLIVIGAFHVIQRRRLDRFRSGRTS